MMFKCLDAMSRDQSILEDGYFKCVEAVRKVVKEVSADLDEMENAYVASCHEGLGEVAGVWCRGPAGHAYCRCQRMGQAPYKTHSSYGGVPQ